MSTLNSRRLLMGMATGGLGIVIKTGLNLLLIPILIQLLGVDTYAVYILILGTLELAITMDLGFYRSIVTLLNSHPHDDSTQQQTVLGLGHSVYLVLSIVLGIIGYTAIPQFNTWFHIPGTLEKMTHICLALMLAEIMLTLYSFYYRSILMAHMQHQWINILDTLFVIISTGAGLILVWKGYGLIGLFSARLAATIMRAIALMALAKHYSPYGITVPKITQLHRSTLWQMIKLSYHSAILNISIQISHNIDTYVIASCLPLRYVALYEIVFRFLAPTQQIALKLNEGIFPLFAKAHAQNLLPQAQQLFIRMSSFLSFVTGVLLVIITLLYADVLPWITHHKITVNDTWSILMLALPIVFSGAMQMPATSFLFASGQEAYLSRTSILAAAANLVLSLTLVRFFGVFGVLIGTLIPQIVQHQCGLIARSCSALQIGVIEYIYRVHGLNLPFIVVAALWVWLGQKLLTGWLSPVWIIVLGSSSAILLSVSAWIWFRCTMEEKQRVLSKLFPCLIK